MAAVLRSDNRTFRVTYLIYFAYPYTVLGTPDLWVGPADEECLDP